MTRASTVKFRQGRCPKCGADGAKLKWTERKDGTGRVRATTENSPMLVRCDVNVCHLRVAN